LINIFGSKSRTVTQLNSQLFFPSTSLAHFMQRHPINAQHLPT